MKEQFKINPLRPEVSSIKKDKVRISRVWFVWFFAGLATTSLSLVILFWHTSVFQDLILAQLEIKNGTQTYSWWENPPVSPLLTVKIFNYTNVEDYEAGRAAKLHVEEVGPYIYRETLTRVNVVVNDNGTISYQDNRTHRWEGGRPEDDMIQVPNVPFIAAVQKLKVFGDYLPTGPLFEMSMKWSLNMMGVKPFKLLTVKEYLWGYTDNLLEPAITIMSYAESLPYDKFGMLMARAGVSKDRLTVRTGSDDINNVGSYQSINGMESRNVWKSEECDKIEGTDGSVFPPNLFQDRNANLTIYLVDMCRKFRMRFHSWSTSFDVPTLRYKPTKDIFTSSNTTNSCFCQKGSYDNGHKIQTCPPVGVFNMSACTYGLPLLLSYPHFYAGEKVLLNNVQGLNPRQELHESYADLHPRLGVVMGGKSRFQMNVQVSVLDTVPVLGALTDGLILPVLWFEIAIDKLPDSVLSLFKQAYYTAGIVECSLQWGSLLCTILSMCAMAILLKKHRETESPKWQNKVSLKNGC